MTTPSPSSPSTDSPVAHAGSGPGIPVPAISAEHALFLDFDGTLVDIAQTPDGVVLPTGLVQTLAGLHEALGGALGIITGRPLDQVDHYLAPLVLAVAGEHGAVRRAADGVLSNAPVPDLMRAIAAMDDFSRQHSGLMVERKGHGLALHYRAAPDLGPACLELANTLAAQQPGLVVLHGKAVVELKSAEVDKGRALAALMQSAPFAGRRPLFVGDDTTDEAAIAVAQQLGGTGIKVGEGASAAQARLASPQAVLAYLQAAAQALAPQPQAAS